MCNYQKMCINFVFKFLAHVLLHFIDIDSEFKQFLYELVPILLSPENLVVKKINGITMTGKGLLQCFQVISDFSNELIIVFFFKLELHENI